MSRQSVLIVDDDPDIREILAETLVDKGFDVATAANGLEALRILRSMSVPPSVILLDLMMPVMDGWAFRQELLKEPALAAIPVVVMTAATPARAAAVDSRAILYKPLHMGTVVGLVQEHCPDGAG
jgi:CheY-like chemotaxis protein